MRIATIILSLVLITAAAFLSVKGFYRVTEERLRVEQVPVDVGETPDGASVRGFLERHQEVHATLASR